MTQQFVPPESKLEAVARMSNLTDSGQEDLGPGSKEHKSVLLNLAKGLNFPVNSSLAKPKLGQEVAQHLGVDWDESCFSTGSTITLEGLARLLEGAEGWLLSRGRPVGLPKRALGSPQDEAAAILSVLAPQLSGVWDGRECITEMREAEDTHWAQDKWAGWYFEYRARGELLKELGGGPRKFANTSFDYHLNSTWDLKAHSESRADAPLNDQVAMREAVEDGSGLGFVILSGERLDDDGAFRQWQRDYRLEFDKGPRVRRVAPDDEVVHPSPRTGTSTVQFRPTRLEIFHIPDRQAFDQALDQGVLRTYKQGPQPSGKPRKPKFKLMLKQARQTILLDALIIGAEGARPKVASGSAQAPTTKTGREPTPPPPATPRSGPTPSLPGAPEGPARSRLNTRPLVPAPETTRKRRTADERDEKTPPVETVSGYMARHLQVLEGLEAVRKRPGMYIGSTDSRGLMHCVWEIIDNAVDEALAGACDRIDVVLRSDGSVEVRDNGRGIPVDLEPRTGLSGVEVVFTKLHAGGKFGGGSFIASGGLHGVGASVVNALSARLDVEVDRGMKTYAMSFRRGEPGVFSDGKDVRGPAGKTPDALFTAYVDNSELRVVGKAARGRTGSRIHYWPDHQIFIKGAAVTYDELAARARQTSYLIPGLTLVIRDERGVPGTPGEHGPHEETFLHHGGISEFAEFLAIDPGLTDVWRLQGSGTFRETVPVLDERGHMTPTEVVRECAIDVAVRWGTGYETKVVSFVNIIATPKGGTHMTGFEQSLLKVFRRQLEVNGRRLKVGSDKVDKEDILAGLTAVVTVRLAEPQFEGQTKEVLGTSAVRAIVATVIEKELSARLTSSKRGERAQSALLLEKVVAEMKSRISARLHRETQRRKNALETSSLPAKLADCRSSDVDRTELFIVEGDSALGTAKLARSSDYQALLPIRGKILNVQKARIDEVMRNSECAAILQVIGAGSGASFDLDAARYGKVIIMTDADVDGAHIRTLLLTLFFRYMRPLVDAGRVYAAVPPLHRIEVINSGGKKNDLLYTYSEAEMRTTLSALGRKGRKVKTPMQRYKGLGEMDADQLAETTMDPRHRTLRRVTLKDAEIAERVFDLLMGNDVAPRKDFIIDSAAELDRQRIDA